MKNTATSYPHPASSLSTIPMNLVRAVMHIAATIYYLLEIYSHSTISDLEKVTGSMVKSFPVRRVVESGVFGCAVGLVHTITDDSVRSAAAGPGLARFAPRKPYRGVEKQYIKAELEQPKESSSSVLSPTPRHGA